MKKIIDFYANENKDHWLSEINRSDWRAGKYLYELLRVQKLKELCGETTKVLLLIDGDKIPESGSVMLPLLQTKKVMMPHMFRSARRMVIIFSLRFGI